MHIRTDDEVYRVDAVWLGPPRATFPWRARYSAYGVGLLVVIVVMFLQRRLGIPLGFFSVAWALLITVLVTRFVSRRINDERPLLEWLTLFAHELRGPRVRTRSVGGALATGHVRVHRDRPRLAPSPTPVALPPGSTPPGSTRVVGPREHPDPQVPTPRTPATTPDAAGRAPSHRPARTGEQAARPTRSGSPARPARPARSARRRADAGFGPPSATELGEPVEPRPAPRPDQPDHREHGDRSAPADGPAALPAAPAMTAPDMAAWTGADREPVRVRARRLDDATTGGDAGRGSGARAFGPGARRGGPTRKDDGARP